MTHDQLQLWKKSQLDFLEHLRTGSTYYPEISTVVSGGVVFCHTLVRRECEGLWYTTHIVESYTLPPRVSGYSPYKRLCYDNLIASVYKCILFGKHSIHDRLDELQISEWVRLMPRDYPLTPEEASIGPVYPCS